MEEAAETRPADAGELTNGAPEPEAEEAAAAPEVVEEEEEDEEPPRSATAKQEEAKAALGAEGSRPFTMRELLGELKEDSEGAAAGGTGGDSARSAFGEGSRVGSADAEGSSYSQDSNQQLSSHHDVAMELINSVTGVDEEGRSRQRILSFAAKRYVSAIERNPDDPDAYYNWALVLQESADNVDPNSSSSKDALLEEACKKYAEATRLCPTLYDAILNYEKAVQLNWNSPQALNNWGLGLQELSAIVPARDKQTIIKTAIIWFSRGYYEIWESQMSPLTSFTLPLPYLKVGYLTAPPANNALAPHKDWVRSQFILNHEGLQQADASDQPPSQSPGHMDRGRKPVRINVSDIVSVSACADLTLPSGAGLCIETIHGPTFLVADSWEALDGWLDAIRLVYTIFARGKSDVLAGIITG
ncbi:hypothetical protein PR202_ga07601 [Eleusine coracana subsp. coracana]|uniref:PH domain-containing protein n=1 Tax=Eleusine coracana subsp. coracana TaxID=191504 RepID=A0AAV5BXZ0_ELECO|nr:hypothetical protein PR202_ga07601 [Eleusine coracana subsp. coracana]